MLAKTLILPERKRVLTPPFAWIDRRFLINGFLAVLSHHENLLYFFLVLAADREGLSFYGYDKICQLLQLAVDDYIQARNGLIDKGLIAFDGRQFQVLALPKSPPRQYRTPLCGAMGSSRDAEALATVFARLAKGDIQHQTPPDDRQVKEQQFISYPILAKHS